MIRFISILLIVGCSASAATYYVATDGNDANSGTATNAAWLHIGYAAGNSGQRLGQLAAGDTVYIRGGTYYGNLNTIDRGTGAGNTGTAGSPITFSAYPGERVVITDCTNPSPGVVLKDRAYWVFKDLMWSNIYGGMFLVNVTNFTITNCIFTTMRDDVSYTNQDYEYACVYIGSASQKNKFINCIVTNWGAIFTNTGSANQWQIAGTPISFGDYGAIVPFTAYSYYNLVQGCTFSHCGHDLFQLNTGYNVIRSNLFFNDPWLATNSLRGWQYYNYGNPRTVNNALGAWGARITKPGGGDNDWTRLGTNYNTPDLRTVFEGNTMLYGALPADSNSGVAIELATRVGIYRYNVIAYCQGSGIYLNHSGNQTNDLNEIAVGNPAFYAYDMKLTNVTQEAMSTLNTIYNNTIVGNGTMIALNTGFTSPASGVDLSTFLNANINNYFVNNIIVGNSPTNVQTAIFTYERWYTNWNGDVTAADPKFVSTNGAGYYYNPATLSDFHLQASSPCIDQGTWLAKVTSANGSGTSFTVDNSLYFSDGNQIVTGDVIQLQGQTATATITANDWTNNVLTFTPALTWTNGQGVSLQYSGSAPDMGAFEYVPPNAIITGGSVLRNAVLQ